jgi:hypothetical protein
VPSDLDRVQGWIRQFAGMDHQQGFDVFGNFFDAWLQANEVELAAQRLQ